jgi:hypothetical protein
MSALLAGSYIKTARFYQVCGELAHKKEQYAKLGDEQGNTGIIEKLQSELVTLAPNART